MLKRVLKPAFQRNCLKALGYRVVLHCHHFGHLRAMQRVAHRGDLIRGATGTPLHEELWHTLEF